MHKLSRWGSSTGLRLPAPVCEAARLRPGDYVYIACLAPGTSVFGQRARGCRGDVQTDGAPAVKEVVW